MAKRKRKRKSKGRRGLLAGVRSPQVDLSATYAEAEQQIARGRPADALSMLEPLVEQYPRDALLHYFIGYANGHLGRPYAALLGYEQAHKLNGDPTLWLSIAALYIELELNAHALEALRQAVHHKVAEPVPGQSQASIDDLEQNVADVAAALALTPKVMERGLYHMEDGIRALQSGDFADAVSASRRAAKTVGNWPPPSNNLAQALFFDGSPQQAIEVAQQVLDYAPDNIPARANLIRFLAWTGRRDDALELWSPFSRLAPEGRTDTLKMAEAAADVDEDAVVRDLLLPLANEARALYVKMQQLLGTALANLGEQTVALTLLRQAEAELPWIAPWLAALAAGKPGPGLAKRYPYYHSAELLPQDQLAGFMDLVQRQNEMSDVRFNNQLANYVRRYPQLALFAEKAIWEDGGAEAGVHLLGMMDTPAAHAALRRFAISDAGEDEPRRLALLVLQRCGQLRPGEMMRIWHEGAWVEVQPHTFEIVEEHDRSYAWQVTDRLDRGVEAMHEQRYDDAERLFREAVKRDPKAREGYNNLAALYSIQERHAEAEAMLRRALKVDPDYIMARVNLASSAIFNDDVDLAKALLAPVAAQTTFTLGEIVRYKETEARIALAEEEYEDAKAAAKFALELEPDNEPVRELIAHIDLLLTFQDGFGSFFDEHAKRNRAKRIRMQRVLTSTSVSVEAVLSVYTKEMMTAMARVIVPFGGWSSLRKAELLARIAESLVDEQNLVHIVARLENADRDAIRFVLANDGVVAWQAFADRFDDDLDASPYWHYHEPETVMGRLRQRALLAEVTVDEAVLMVVPVDLRGPLVALYDG